MAGKSEAVHRRGAQLHSLVLAAGLALALVSLAHAQDFADSSAPPAAAIHTQAATDNTLKRDYTQSAIPLSIVLAPVGDAEKAALTRESKDQPLQIGFGRAIPAPYQGDIQPLLEWVQEADGTATAVLTVTSPGAQALRIALDVTDLPEGVELRFFSLAMPPQVFGPFTARELRPGSKDAAQTAAEATLYWSPVIEGETIGVELRLTQPAQQAGFVLAVAQVSHLEQSVLMSTKRLADIGTAGSCNIDVRCRTVADAIRGATAKIIFTTGGRSFLCTGTLMNDQDSDSFIPYFLTANHCLDTQAAASTVNSYWLFERATCGGPDPTSVIQRTGGGELLTTGTNSDFTFMQLNDEVGTISGVVFAGWDAAPLPASTRVVTIHHPIGDLKKWSQGTHMGFADYLGAVNGTGSHLLVLWSQGTTEGGSSGAGLFDPSDRLRGTLHGGGAACSTSNAPDYYGRFDLTFPSVQPWLSAGATGLTLGRPVTDTVQQGQWKEYKIASGATQTQFIVGLSGLNQDADLYIRKGSRPTLTQYDCRPFTGGTSAETCPINNSGSNVYYISVRGASAGPTSFTLAVNAPPFPPPSPGLTFTLTVAQAGSGSGTVTSTVPGIICGNDCAETLVSGTTVTLTATAAPGSAFAGWRGGGCSGTTLCTVVVNADTTITATFVPFIGAALVAAVLPSSRSVQVGTPATVFVTIINTAHTTASGCRLSPTTSVPATFAFQTTNAATNQVTGPPNTAVDIPAGTAQSFVLVLTPSAPFTPTDVALSFVCVNTDTAPSITGLNTLLLAASGTPAPDIVALAATLTNNGITTIPGPMGTGVFSVATVNVGAGGTITATADTGGVNLPLTLTLCETNPSTGMCLAPPAQSVTTQINANATPTFGIFVMGNNIVPFDPAHNRLFVRFRDAGRVTRGATSVAVQTQR